MEITHRTIETNGIAMHVAEAGSGPLVVFLHGFPELWISYRSQLASLSDAGFHVVAPDQRGYGTTTAPQAVDQYTMLHLIGDIVGLLGALGEKDCVLVGHDMGAIVAANFAVLRPDLVRALVLLSVPYFPRGDVDSLTAISAVLGPNNYQVFHQLDGEAEAYYEADIEATMESILLGLSGDAPQIATGQAPTGPATRPPVPRPDWLSAETLQAYVDGFSRSGFRGALNWYRNSNANWQLLSAWHGAPVSVPSLFIGGERDLVCNWPGFAELIGVLQDFSMPSLEGTVILEGCGHWTQQERAKEVNELIEDFARRHSS